MRIFKKGDPVNKEKQKLNKIISEKSFTYAPFFKKIREHLKPQSKILDAGCGEGNVSLILAKNHHRVWGIDLSKKAIALAEKRAKKLNLEKHATFYIGNLEKLTINKKFDVIFCIEVLEHVRNDEKVIKNLFSHLKSGGLILITVPSKSAPLYKLKSVKKYDTKIGHLRRYCQKELIEKLKKAGFKQITLKKTEGLLRNFLFFTAIGRLLLKFVNRSILISKLFEKVDCAFLKIFEGSQITAFANKK
ncbi:MAG: class I SAM-dependent methyltransferase [Candidatus Shapirobacteria bacterium]|nr:class I SAM-dependent methyltransferase [Candidatus Shapirobacteria bacterium]MDD5481721.1 class I SAM-dependent methyltransferase [Candidatus Shapirobacteria bacterium]